MSVIDGERMICVVLGARVTKHTDEYLEYIRSREWQGKRKLALNFAGHSCQLCGSSLAPLHVHHRNYRRLKDEYISDLLVLCRRCHAVVDALRDDTYDGKNAELVEDPMYWAILADQEKRRREGSNA